MTQTIRINHTDVAIIEQSSAGKVTAISAKTVSNFFKVIISLSGCLD